MSSKLFVAVTSSFSGSTDHQEHETVSSTNQDRPKISGSVFQSEMGHFLGCAVTSELLPIS